jgi:hypothetical protein
MTRTAPSERPLMFFYMVRVLVNGRSWRERRALRLARKSTHFSKRERLQQSLINIQNSQLDAMDNWEDITNMIEIHKCHQGEREQDSYFVAHMQRRVAAAQQDGSSEMPKVTDGDLIDFKARLRQDIAGFSFTEKGLSSKYGDEWRSVLESEPMQPLIFTKDRLAALAALDRQKWLYNINDTTAKLESQHLLDTLTRDCYYPMICSYLSLENQVREASPKSLITAIHNDTCSGTTDCLERWIASNREESSPKLDLDPHLSAMCTEGLSISSLLSALHDLLVPQADLHAGFRQLSSEPRVFLEAFQSLVRTGRILSVLPLDPSDAEKLELALSQAEEVISVFRLQEQKANQYASQQAD